MFEILGEDAAARPVKGAAGPGPITNTRPMHLYATGGEPRG